MLGPAKKRHILIWPLACHSFAHCPIDRSFGPSQLIDTCDAIVSEAEIASRLGIANVIPRSPPLIRAEP